MADCRRVQQGFTFSLIGDMIEYLYVFKITLWNVGQSKLKKIIYIYRYICACMFLCAFVYVCACVLLCVCELPMCYVSNLMIFAEA